MQNELKDRPLIQENLWLSDDNVSNHLFRLQGDILDKPGIISAKWSDSGKLLNEDIWSFLQLQSRARKCIVYLQDKGLKRGDRVLLMVRPGLELIVICFALFRLGCIPIVIDPGMGLKKFRRAVEHSKPNMLIGIAVAGWVKTFFPKSFKSVTQTLIVGKRFVPTLDQVDDSSPIEVCQTSTSDMGAILFTSGSTGAPKGVCYEHGMFNAQIRLLRDYLDIKPGEIDLPMLPIFALFNPAMGMTTVMPEINPSRPASVNPAKIIAAIQRYGVTNSFGSPVLWRKIGDYCEKEGIQLDTMNRILVAGAAAPTQLYRQFDLLLPKGHMYSPYGATECLPVSIIQDRTVLNLTAKQTDQGAGICVGEPLSEVSVRIVSGDENKAITDLEQGEIGEILVHGPSVTKAYDNLPEVNAKSKILIDGNTWHRMGDMGYFDPSGKLWFCGRKVERVIHENTPFYTECLEGCFVTHPWVKRCAMIAWQGNQVSSCKNGIALVVEPELGHFPKHGDEAQKFANALIIHLLDQGMESPVDAFFFENKLPVDVRHNAKIHRLTLTEICARKQPIIAPSKS